MIVPQWARIQNGVLLPPVPSQLSVASDWHSATPSPVRFLAGEPLNICRASSSALGAAAASACSRWKRPVRSRTSRKAVPSMLSAVSIQLGASNALQEVSSNMQSLPADYASRIEVNEAAIRQLPPEESEEAMAIKERALANLRDLAEANIESLRQSSPTLAAEKILPALAPRYYFTELRRQRDCDLPPAPAAFEDDALLRLLGAAMVARVRTAERCSRKAECGNPGIVQPEVWAKLSEASREAALNTAIALMQLFEESVVLREVRLAGVAENEITRDLLDGSEGSVRFIEGRGGVQERQRSQLFLVSDCTGESAEKTVQAALGQFSHCLDRPASTEDIRVFAFTRRRSDVRRIVEEAKTSSASIIFTLVDPVVIQEIKKECEDKQVRYLDLWSPLLSFLEGYMETTPMGTPGKRLQPETLGKDDKYNRLASAIEFQMAADDGLSKERWHEADLILVGPSRSGKTRLGFHLAQHGYKVANYPLVQDEEVPNELFEVAQSKIVALLPDAETLMKIRAIRMKKLKMSKSSEYGLLEPIKREMDWAKTLYMRNPQWLLIREESMGLEEIANVILQKLSERRVRS
eukprot:TRINITY_DN12099_c1_g1_i2.p1 TRINITY_DN12099_c1_g1~~TRINITY_DN12099_c1_g1_i2.p1  ORF type:complete len:581 (-),score=136.35 TRINITY_DN12099_c1_g1_i2:296-2038(-)